MFISGGFGMQDLQYVPLSLPLQLRAPPPKQYLLSPVNDGTVFGVYCYCLRGCGLYSGIREGIPTRTVATQWVSPWAATLSAKH